MSRLKPGDVVRHTSKFLRSVGWFVDVPKNGKVVSVEENSPKNAPYVVEVQWCDRDEPIRILSCNIERVKWRS